MQVPSSTKRTPTPPPIEPAKLASVPLNLPPDAPAPTSDARFPCEAEQAAKISKCGDTPKCIATNRPAKTLKFTLIDSSNKSSRSSRAKVIAIPSNRILPMQVGKIRSTQMAGTRGVPPMASRGKQESSDTDLHTTDLSKQSHSAGSLTITLLAQAVAAEVAALLKPEFAHLGRRVHNADDGGIHRKEALMKNLLKVPEAAIQLNLSVKTTWKMVYGRKVVVVHLGRAVRITQESVDKLIDDGTIPTNRDDDDM